MIGRRGFLATCGGFCLAGPVFPTAADSKAVLVEPEPWAGKLIAAGEARIGRTILYDPAYRSMPYPMGDVADDRGVCTDVIIRAYRDGLGIDLQRLVHEDMRANFAAYPKTWGLKRTDRNIDHRRVPNLQRFFERAGAEKSVTKDPADYLPGDVVSQLLPGNLTHIVLVTHYANKSRDRPLVLHNIGAGTRLEDRLFDFEITGHYRFPPPDAEG